VGLGRRRLWENFSTVRGLIYLICGLCSLHAAPANRCAPCHPAQVRAFAKTGMGQSLTRLATQPAGRFVHSESGTKFSVRTGDDGIVQIGDYLF